MSTPDLAAAMAKLQAMRAAKEQPPAQVPAKSEEPAAPPAPAAGSLAARLLAKANATRQLAAPAPVAAPASMQPTLLPFVPPSVAPELQERAPELVQAVFKLAEALHAQEPGMDFFLKDIHKALRGEPELLHVMTDEQIEAVYQAQIAHSKIAVVPGKAKAPSKSKAALAKATSDDDM